MRRCPFIAIVWRHRRYRPVWASPTMAQPSPNRRSIPTTRSTHRITRWSRIRLSTGTEFFWPEAWYLDIWAAKQRVWSLLHTLCLHSWNDDTCCPKGVNMMVHIRALALATACVLASGALTQPLTYAGELHAEGQ